jgi:predicted DNA-binding transcriptional regulator YafY
MPPIIDTQIVEIDYTNYRGERTGREIMPISIRFGTNEWHTDEQWLLLARDIAKGENREFAMDTIHSWSR